MLCPTVQISPWKYLIRHVAQEQLTESKAHMTEYYGNNNNKKKENVTCSANYKPVQPRKLRFKKDNVLLFTPKVKQVHSRWGSKPGL